MLASAPTCGSSRSRRSGKRSRSWPRPMPGSPSTCCGHRTLPTVWSPRCTLRTLGPPRSTWRAPPSAVPT
jgi:hypothetical protein